MLDERIQKKYGTIQYMYRRALPSGSRYSIPLPALTLHPHLFLSLSLSNLSPAHLHVCRQGDISRFSFRGCLRLIALIVVFLAPALLFSFPIPISPSFQPS
jgi:hypothetical protein